MGRATTPWSGGGCTLPRLGGLALFAAGAAVLLAYGVTVNAPPLDLGKLLGVYVTLFFVVTQVINFAAFGKRPDLPVLVGGALIVSGGLLVALWRP